VNEPDAAERGAHGPAPADGEITGPTLVTERLGLRPVAWADLDDLAAMFADPAVMRYITAGEPRPRERVRQSVAWGRRLWRERGFGPFVCRLRGSGAFVGDAIIVPILHSRRSTGSRTEASRSAGGAPSCPFDERGPDIELGYRLARAHWGAGYATEAASAALHWALTPRDADDPTIGGGLTRLVGVTDPDNAASQRVLEKIGMRRVGVRGWYYDRELVVYEVGGGATEARSDGGTKRRSDGATERRRDGET
jgi:RimJ/RimL family protein N-acetyltransferase